MTLISQTSHENDTLPSDVCDDVVEVSFVDLSQLSISDSLASSDESLLLISSLTLSDVDADEDADVGAAFGDAAFFVLLERIADGIANTIVKRPWGGGD